ncbi:hypothetical protein DFP73DRAFT_583238 [Morchella snyderi]|nr:hypothetical protein DFP73DRAFT_583238 [Morchella snyderi]
MVFGYPLEILDSYVYMRPTTTSEDSAPKAVTPAAPISTLSRAPSQRNLARKAHTVGLGNGHFSTGPPSEMSRAGYFSHLATSRGGVATNAQVVTTEEGEYTMYGTNAARGPGPHDPRLSGGHGSRPATYIQAYTAADIAAGLCPNPPPRSGTPGGPRREHNRQPSNGSSVGSTAQGDTSPERRERTSRWVNYAPTQSSSTQEVLSLGHRQSIGTLRRSGHLSQDTCALHTTSQRYCASGPHGLTPPPAMVYGGEGEPTVRKRSPLLPRPASGPRGLAPPAMVYGGAGEPVVRRKPSLLRRPSRGNEPAKALKSAMKNTGSEETGSRTTGRSVKFAKEKSVMYYSGAGN